MADLIDRQELLKAIGISPKMVHDFYIEDVEAVIKEQPPADTERHAHWIIEENGLYAKCSNCGLTEYSNDYSIDEKFYNDENRYCRYCGCKMGEVAANENVKA